MQSNIKHENRTNTRGLMINGNDFTLSPAISTSSWGNNGAAPYAKSHFLRNSKNLQINDV